MEIPKNSLLTNLFFILAAIVLQSCCTKKYCDSVSNQLEFRNFSSDEVDSVLICRYKRDNHSTPLDSGNYFNQTYPLNSNATNYSLAYSIDWNYDYKIKLLSTELEYWITNFETGKEGCNSCFPYRPQSDYYTVLRSYRVNDKYSPASYGSIVITK